MQDEPSVPLLQMEHVSKAFPGVQARTALQTMVNFVVNGTTPENEVNLLSPKLITADNIDEAERIGEIE